MRYLRDTNVVSALRVRGRNPALEAWAVSAALRNQILASTTPAEIERGVASRERSDTEQGAVLRRWLSERVLPAFADRILPIDLAAARVLATYPILEHPPLDDALIAAVAQANKLVVPTRNTKRLEPLRVRLLNPCV